MHRVVVYLATLLLTGATGAEPVPDQPPAQQKKKDGKAPKSTSWAYPDKQEPAGTKLSFP